MWCGKMEEYFVHLQTEDRKRLEEYLGDRNIVYKPFELNDKIIFQVQLEKEALGEISKLEYIALVEPVNPVKILNNQATS